MGKVGDLALVIQNRVVEPVERRLGYRYLGNLAKGLRIEIRPYKIGRAYSFGGKFKTRSFVLFLSHLPFWFFAKNNFVWRIWMNHKLLLPLPCIL